MPMAGRQCASLSRRWQCGAQMRAKYAARRFCSDAIPMRFCRLQVKDIFDIVGVLRVQISTNSIDVHGDDTKSVRSSLDATANFGPNTLLFTRKLQVFTQLL
jgi:hypothetical protein